MMKGFTLLEFLIATTFFLVVLIVGYEMLWMQKDLLAFTSSRVKPDMESNYRMALMKHLLQSSAEPFKMHPMLEAAPTFFPDLSFGQTQRPDAFSLVTSDGFPIPFQQEGAVYRCTSCGSVKIGELLLLTGVTTSQEFTWQYARIRQAMNGNLELEFLKSGECPIRGICIKVQITGILYKQGTLYRISSGGQAAPFLGPIDDFAYSWEPPEVMISWRIGSSKYEFGSVL